MHMWKKICIAMYAISLTSNKRNLEICCLFKYTLIILLFKLILVLFQWF